MVPEPTRELRWRDAAAAAISAAAGLPPASAAWSRRGGSSFHETWRLDLGSDAFFVKINDRGFATMLDAEADGLRTLGAANAVRVPAPVACGVAGERAYLALEWLDFGRGGRDAALGSALAAAAPDDCAAFRRASREHDRHDAAGQRLDRRLGRVLPRPKDRPQLALAAATATAERCSATASGCSRRSPLCSRARAVALAVARRPVVGQRRAPRERRAGVFDPAVYYGDREADLAMTELFGGFGDDFYAAYRDAWPLPAGYEKRRDALQPLPRAQPPEPVRRRLSRAGEAMISRLLSEVR